MAGLAALQDWMQASILGASGAGARAHVLGDNRLTAEDRIHIYASSYRQRLLECLRGEFPVLAALAGETAFDLFAHGYIAAHPSRSYTLYEFGAGFAGYLDGARPPGEADAPAAIPAALARVERARSEVFRAKGIEGEPLPPSDAHADPLIAAMFGLDGRRYWRPDSVRLLALPFDFSATLADRENPPLPLARPSWLAVARTQYRVECHAIEARQYDWLASLAEDAAAASPLPHGDAGLAAWLPVAISRGLVVPVV
ncbi:DNA-binding domain-containing protein [Sphingomonas sp. LB-2]|uniref:HvfC/BufC N-terminal domain-containing protein n=1 Tax=Sphingomonas caeni TaxID=2984949 RepID=UPI0022320165|nr:DNA-binding domain-containing protein [Sphingomonas caeni]MCW3847111.1 DNA-binding domain-containing protein [Sphingomonas caeni]